MTENLNESDFIEFTEFTKVKFKVAQIETVELVEGSNKLYKLTVSLGDSEPKRQVLSGIRKFYTAEELLNKKIILVSNLKPAKIMGLVSEGMLLAADDPSGKVSLLMPDQDIAPGSLVR